MRTCPYCGKTYPDNLIFCPADQRVLLDRTVHWDDNPPAKTGNPSRKRRLKIFVASLAFLPMLVLTLSNADILSISKPVIISCIIFNYPAASFVELIDTFQVGKSVLLWSAFGLMALWSSFMAWVFWKIVATFQGEDEPEATRGQYDWAGFRVRFVIGFVVGFLSGWRFVKHAKTVQTVLIASIITGFIGGFLYGISRPPDFWSRS